MNPTDPDRPTDRGPRDATPGPRASDRDREHLIPTDLGLMALLVDDATESDYERAVRASQDAPVGGHARGAGTRIPTRGWPPAVVVVAALCIYLLIAAFTLTRQGAGAEADERRVLAERVLARTQALQARQEQVDRERQALTDAREQVLAATAAGRALAERIRRLEQATGMLPTTGAGIVVEVIDPAGGRPDSAFLPTLDRVLDRDIQTIVNALWSCGAVAIDVNGQRLTSRTAIRSAGAAILVDYRPVLSPYRISALVDPADTPRAMAGRFATTSAAALLRSLGEEYGIESSVSQERILRLPATSVPLG